MLVMKRQDPEPRVKRHFPRNFGAEKMSWFWNQSVFRSILDRFLFNFDIFEEIIVGVEDGLMFDVLKFVPDSSALSGHSCLHHFSS